MVNFEKHDERVLDSALFKSFASWGFSEFQWRYLYNYGHLQHIQQLPFGPFLSYMSVNFAKDAKLRRSTQAKAEHLYINIQGSFFGLLVICLDISFDEIFNVGFPVEIMHG